MDRVFRHKISIPDVCGIVLFAVLVSYCFWNKMPLVGLAVAVVWILMIERVMHTTYTLAGSRLIIDRGRFSPVRTLDVRTVVACRTMRNFFGLTRYLLLVYGAGRTVSVQPQNERDFINELHKRIEE